MSKTEKHLERIAQLLREESTLSLATSGEDGLPALAPLFYIADDQFTLYWLSAESSRHGLNLAARPSAAVAVYRSVANWRKIRGVQMRGSVRIVTEPERRALLVKAYCDRFKLGTIFRALLRQSALYAFQPDFLRFINNTHGLGGNVELRRGLEGWTHSRPEA